MTRRFFITISALTGSSLAGFSFFSKDDEWKTIKTVQEHLFPKSGGVVSAREVGATKYLKFVAKDNSFDKDDLDFLLEGAEELSSRGFKNSLTYKKNEKILQEFIKTRFGENWVSLVINYTIEAIFSDPIYGGNKDGIGWKNFSHNSGQPFPKTHFGKSHV